jgi:PIN domain nuclease of toxin-antitoxin system
MQPEVSTRGKQNCWWWFEPECLSDPVQALMADPSTKVLVMATTVWELSLKHHRGTLPELGTGLRRHLRPPTNRWLSGAADRAAHGLRARACNKPHPDPFDRLLPAQAELERLLLLTAAAQAPWIRRSSSASPATWSAVTSVPLMSCLAKAMQEWVSGIQRALIVSGLK